MDQHRESDLPALGVRRLLDLSGRVALITGGSRGLGAQIGAALGEMGAKLVVVARNRGDVETAVAKFAAAGVEATGIACDLTQRDTAYEVATEAVHRMGRIDILVNNAGMAFGAPTEQFPLDRWRQLIALNLTAVYLVTQAVAKVAMLPAKYGRVINLSSVAGLHGRHPRAGGSIAYATTKGAVVSFTRALASEWAPYGITVNALAPDVFPTDMTRAMIDRSEQAIVDRIPMGRLGRLDDLSGVAALLASDASAYITGQTIAVDGGSSSV